MPDYASSTQNEKWLYTNDSLAEVRARANREARRALAAEPDGAASSSGNETGGDNGGGGGKGGGAKPLVPARWYASGYASARVSGEVDYDDGSGESGDPWESSPKRGAQALLTPEDEQQLIQFYTGKIHDLIGPAAMVPRLRRDEKVAATTAVLFRRFFLSNSVMVHDPKAIMVASAFLGSKVEDATADVRYLEEGTKLMQAPVPMQDIIDAEIHFLAGVNFELMCYHPYKTVLAYTEDLRTFLKSERGRLLATFPDGASRPVAGEDLRPMHDKARKIVLDAVLSDVSLLYSPGQIGLAAMMVANEELRANPPPSSAAVPYIDLMGYVRARFEEQSEKEHALLAERMGELSGMLRGLKEGKHGCGNHGIDMVKLKAVHKKLKKCRAWGVGSEGGDSKKKKKKKKRKAEDKAGGDGPPLKVPKSES
uniref:Cyclin C-terminal domain-containing protein n=1 Tax=Odontella aurita TaxID=265563 RepID=A0A7S4JQ75_9STRA|mmetsp:Transcript_5121/g.14735  ORF Transcript_5121/g.14735 Transcript_5121/m.14735 type:complete len:425 (+) Transcript_5121:137-1411(+)